MTADIYPVALTVTVEARVAALWKQEKWDRRWMRATWTQARHDRMTELRALLALRRSARRLARRTVDPYPADMTYQAWTQGELVAVFGR